VREPELVEAVPGDARLEVPGVGGSEPGSTVTTQAIVEAVEAETSICDAGWADVKKSREVMEALLEARNEVAQSESQPAREEP
jgi:hypothetical protein